MGKQPQVPFRGLVLQMAIELCFISFLSQVLVFLGPEGSLPSVGRLPHLRHAPWPGAPIASPLHHATPKSTAP